MNPMHFVRLSDILAIWGESTVRDYLSNFHCKRDEDLEDFIRNKAISHEKRAISRTYLLVDDDEHKHIVGYFTLALSSITLPVDSKISCKLKKQMNLYNNRTTGYLIGQLCKNDDVVEKIGSDMLGLSINLIDMGVKTFGGKVICIDCKDNERLMKWYEEYGFTNIGKMENSDLFRMVYICKET